jgi:peptidoglycan/xylan/chitin deacetylase (PgdA/CDA1 family)
MSPTLWPNGAGQALVVNVMYEHWDADEAPGLGPMGNPLRAGLVDFQARSWADYGWKTGVWRILDALKSAEAPATFYASGLLGHTAPDTIRAIVDAGHEICGHAWTQAVMLPALEEADEAEQLERCIRALADAGAPRLRGWMSPRCTPSGNTAALLAAHGFDWIGDVFDAELPYLLDTSGGPITAFPFRLDINDFPTMIRYGQPPRELVRGFGDLATALDDEPSGSYIDVTIHAHVGARPAGLRTLREIIDMAKHRGMWIATRSQVLDHVNATPTSTR